MADLYSETEADGARLVWLLDLTYAGEILRLATEAITVSSDGGDLQYIASLESVSWSDDLRGTEDGQSVSISATAPPGYSWADRVAAGHVLAFATAALSVIRTGDPYESRVRLIDGTVDGPEHGADGEPVRFSLESTAAADRGAILDGPSIIGLFTWPLALNRAQGKAYPIVLGQPKSATDTMPCTPAWVVHHADRRLLIAGHRVGAASVQVSDQVSPGFTILPVETVVDARGTEVATVILPTSGSGAYSAQGIYYVSWSFPNGWGLEHPRGGRPLTGAGDVLEWVLARSTMDVDRGRTAATVDRLNAYQLAGFIDDLEATAWDWVRANLLPILPVEIKRGPDGIYPVILPYDAISADAVAVIDVPRDGLYRSSAVEWQAAAAGRSANEIRVRYALDIDQGDYTRTLVVHGDPDLGTGDDLELHHACRRSRLQSPYSGPSVYTVSADLVYEQDTAARIGRWLASSMAIPSRRISYDAPIRLAYLQPGDVVTLTDPDLSLTAQLCMVRSVTLSDSPTIGIGLETIEGGGR